eukprot:765256-Hanusia_phi.AAC.1
MMSCADPAPLPPVACEQQEGQESPAALQPSEAAAYERALNPSTWYPCPCPRPRPCPCPQPRPRP